MDSATTQSTWLKYLAQTLAQAGSMAQAVFGL